MQKIIPFAPNAPVQPGMFVGRLGELERLERCLRQAKAGRPAHFLVTGERGIGKSSLLNYIKWVAEGSLPLEDESLSFLVVDTDIDSSTTRVGLLEKIRLGLDHALADSEAARGVLKDLWGFLQRVEAGGVRVRPSEQEQADELLAEKFSYTLADIATRLTGDQPSLFSARRDGILILIDEADNASAALGLGSFLKLLSERLQRRGCTKVLLGLAGLPRLRDVLLESHASSLRLFEEVMLGTLSDDDVGRVIDRCLAAGRDLNGVATTITDAARARLVHLSEGYPHFIQQFGYSAFSAAKADVVEEQDVIVGAFAPGGALDLIGERYYRNDYYNKIQSESYRQVLRIMAGREREWITKEQIRKDFKGKETTLANAMKALVDRKIILVKEGGTGVYRLQHRGFAWWIKLRTSDRPMLTPSPAPAAPPTTT